jgi:hypothetical protein
MDRITRELGYNPTHTHRLGEAGLIREPFPLDMWCLESPLGPNQDLELHLNWLAEQLLPGKKYISYLSNLFKVDIYCHKTLYTEQASLVLSPHALRIFTELGLELQVSLISILDDTNETPESPTST